MQRQLETLLKHRGTFHCLKCHDMLCFSTFNPKWRYICAACCIRLHYIVLCYAMLCYIVLHDIILGYIILCCITCTACLSSEFLRRHLLRNIQSTRQQQIMQFSPDINKAVDPHLSASFLAFGTATAVTPSLPTFAVVIPALRCVSWCHVGAAADHAVLAVGQCAVCWQHVLQCPVHPSPACSAHRCHLGHHVWLRSQPGADAVH